MYIFKPKTKILLLVTLCCLKTSFLLSEESERATEVINIYTDAIKGTGISMPNIVIVDEDHAPRKYETYIEKEYPWWTNKDYTTLYINSAFFSLTDAEHIKMANQAMSIIKDNISFLNGTLKDDSNATLSRIEQETLSPLVVKDYVALRDRNYVMNLLKNNKDKVLDMEDDDLKYMIDTHSPLTEYNQYFGNMKIKVFFYNNNPVGFVTYIMDESYSGSIETLVVDEQFQGKGYGKKIVNYVLDQLQKMKAQTVEIATVAGNTGAQKLYESLGFIIQEVHEDGSIDYVKNLPININNQQSATPDNNTSWQTENNSSVLLNPRNHAFIFDTAYGKKITAPTYINLIRNFIYSLTPQEYTQALKDEDIAEGESSLEGIITAHPEWVDPNIGDFTHEERRALFRDNFGIAMKKDYQGRSIGKLKDILDQLDLQEVSNQTSALLFDYYEALKEAFQQYYSNLTSTGKNDDFSSTNNKQLSPSISIKNYIPVRDKNFVIKLLQDHKTMLFSNLDNDTINDFISFTLATHSPAAHRPEFFGKLKAKILFDNNQPVGLITYFMRTPTIGTIDLLAIDSSVQGKGYGAQMIHYALQELANMGAKKVKLFTKSENIRAQKLYERLGFIVHEKDDEGIDYVKNLSVNTSNQQSTTPDNKASWAAKAGYYLKYFGKDAVDSYISSK